MTAVHGIHHVSAIASDARRAVDFYAGLLGLRLVKRTVDFDDPLTPHLSFGDGTGSPGSLMTLFIWPGAFRGRQGTGQVAVTAFAVRPDAVGTWLARLIARGVPHEGPVRRAGERVLRFADPDGLLVEIVGSESAEEREGWDGVPGLPREHALRGLHGVTLWVERPDDTERTLVDGLGMRAVREDDGTRRYAADAGGSGALVDVRAIGGFVTGAEGAGTVHHVAWRVPDDAGAEAVSARLAGLGLLPTPLVDRRWFRSVYCREASGILHEIATDGPGVGVDEPAGRLGETLVLPPWHEPLRATIEAAYPDVDPPSPPTGAAFRDPADAG